MTIITKPITENKLQKQKLPLVGVVAKDAGKALVATEEDPEMGSATPLDGRSALMVTVMRNRARRSLP